MAKEKNYFSHDYNARNDRKIAALVMEYKSSGYGIYWATCEMMHEEGGLLEMDDITYSAISKDLNEEFDLVKSVILGCIQRFKLFILCDNEMKSNRVTRNLDKRSNISDKRRKAAFAKHLQTNAEQDDAFDEQNGAKKERKKERKKEMLGRGFSEDGLSVFFEDGSSQLLGLRQRQCFKEGGYEPHYIKKGLIE